MQVWDKEKEWWTFCFFLFSKFISQMLFKVCVGHLGQIVIKNNKKMCKIGIEFLGTETMFLFFNFEKKYFTMTLAQEIFHQFFGYFSSIYIVREAGFCGVVSFSSKELFILLLRSQKSHSLIQRLFNA